MAGIKIPVEAAFDKGAADATLKDFTASFNALGEQIAKLNKIKFQPIDKASIDHLKQVNAQFQNLLKLSPGLSKRVGLTGQQGKAFHELDWNKIYADQPKAAPAKMATAFAYVTQGQPFGLQTPAAPPHAPPAPPPGGGGGHPPAAPPPPDPPQSTLMRNLKRILGSATSASGAGGVAGPAMGDFAKFGLGAGVAGLLGGVAALAIGKVVGAVREKIGDAQQEGIGYDTLMRRMGGGGAGGPGFEALRGSMRMSTDGLGLDYQETLKLGSEFVRQSGVHGSAGMKEAAESVRFGTGMSRAFGLDPEQGVGFMANMRHYKAAGSVEENRRLGMMIGEGIARAGVFAKADEVLSAVEDFAANAAKSALQAPNVGAYMQQLTGMMGSGIPGLDPANSAAILARANAAVAGGGDEAMQNFWYRTIGTRQGLNPVQSIVQREGGLFASGESTFGKGKAYSEFMEAFGFGGVAAGARAKGTGETNFELMMKGLQEQYAGQDPNLMLNALSRLTGLNHSQAAGLGAAYKKHGGKALGGLEKRLERLGIDPSQVNATGLMEMAQHEASALSEPEKDEKIKQAAVTGQLKTEGSETRRSIAEVSRAVQDAATLLVGPLNAIRTATMWLAGDRGKMSPQEIADKMADLEAEDRKRSARGEAAPKIADAKSAHEAARAARMQEETRQRLTGEKDPAKLEALHKAETQAAHNVARETARRDMTVKDIADEQAYRKSTRRPPGYHDFDSLYMEMGQRYGIDPKHLKGMAIKESNQNPRAISPPNANGSGRDRGLFQHNDAYRLERGLGGDDVYDPVKNAEATAKLLIANGYRKDPRTAIRKHNGAGPKAEAYADDVLKISEGVQLSPGAMDRERAIASRAVQNSSVARVEGNFTLTTPSGQQAAPPLQVKTTVGKVEPQGAW